MQILVTGARGKVGAATIHDLIEAGHEVTGCDLAPPVYEGGDSGAHYVQADLSDPGDAFAVVRGQDVVIHCAALPEPTRNAPHTVFRNNLMATFNLVEACVRLGADRIVNVSSETVAGMAFAERPFHAPYAPIDEELENRPQDPYALAKDFGEQLMDAAVARSDLRAISIRPVLGAVGGQLRAQPRAVAARSVRGAAEPELLELRRRLRPRARAAAGGRELAATGTRRCTSSRPTTATGRPLAELIAHHFGEDVSVRDLPREDAGGISHAKAERLLGYQPTRSWRDYL